ncbi:MAG: 4-hydroxythreonine-4-phosphate dehydrogenase PdxA [Burkholderiales bacterium]|nr:4-hydroxythreonine-4-phosphate dehydrogenase PdxA [Burkholderiales bacterium]
MAAQRAEAPAVAVTTGEPSGIGPDLAMMLAARPRARAGARLVLVGDADLLARRARRLGIAPLRRVIAADDVAPAGASVMHVPLARREHAGRPDPANAGYVLRTLDAAVDGCAGGRLAAIATAPVHKGVINDAGIAFTGHTEYLAARTGARQVVMMLTGGRPVLRVALATTHLALRDVAATLDRASLARTIEILDADLRGRFGIARPRILVAGLNPHAGESGHLGREEIEIIAPVIARLRRRGIALDGPLPADTLFTPAVLARGDAVLAMYHDQGLPVLKYATFGQGVNVTLGLPLIRTSVDHGTALDLAASAARAARADPGSLITAFRLARDLARAARRRPAQPDRRR